MKKLIFALIAALIMVLGAVSTVHAAGGPPIQVNLINQDPDPAVAGDIAELRLGVQNIGGQELSDLVVELKPEYPFLPVPGDELVKQVGSLQGYQGYYNSENMNIIKFRIRIDKEAVAGTYNLKILNYESTSPDAVVERTIPIVIKNSESAEVIHIDKTNILPGKQSSLMFSINNVGGAPLRDLIFYWENEDKVILPVGSDNTRYVKYIEIGDSAEIDYQVIADSNAAPGLYKLNLYLTYDDLANGSSKKISTIAGVYVGGETDFDVAFSENANSQISFSIANIGSNPANSVSVSIPDQKAWRVSGSNAVIIGNLNKGDYTVASFKLQPASGQQNANGGAAKTKSSAQKPANLTGVPQDMLNIRIAYTDTMGERRTVDKMIKLSPQSLASADTAAALAARKTAQQGFFSTYKWYIILLLVFAAGFTFYTKRKHKRWPEKKDFTNIVADFREVFFRKKK